MTDGRCWVTTGAVMAGLAVAFGAFGAHGIDDFFARKYANQVRTVTGVEIPAAVKYMEDYQTGVRYHMWHALALLTVGLSAQFRPGRTLNAAGYCFVLGIVLFSGSLYLLTLTDPIWMGVPWGLVAAAGGTMFLVGWALFAAAVCPCSSNATQNSTNDHN